MKATVIFGSPRKAGNTASLLEVFREEFTGCGGEIEYFDVYEKNIAGCRVCLECQKDTSRICCAVKDDMQPLLESISSSELIVVAAPIYLWSAPAPVKAALDRMVYASCKYYGEDPHGPALLRGKRLAIITSCGYPVEKGTDLYEEMMKRFCKHCGLSYAGMLAERQRNLKEEFMDEDKEQRAKAFAREMVKNNA